MKMNWPNRLTILRMILVIPFIVIMSMAIYYHFKNGTYTGEVKTYLITGGAIFTIAMITDALDGYLARRNNQITNFGKLFDPLADKFMTTSAFILLTVLNLVPFWVTILFVLRDILVDGSRNIAAVNNVKVAASIWGKIKTVAQTIGLVLIFFISPFLTIDSTSYISLSRDVWLINIPVFIALVASLFSGYLYFQQILKFIK